MNINWNEMPVWADVWIESVTGNIKSEWHKDCGDIWKSRSGDYWMKPEDKGYFIVHYPPENKPEWNGEGLPPVGSVCQMFMDGYLVGDQVLIMGYFDDLVWVTVQNWYDDGSYSGSHKTFIVNDTEFRPIKSDKEKWIEQAKKRCDPDYGQIYDAIASGELRIPEVKK